MACILCVSAWAAVDAVMLDGNGNMAMLSQAAAPNVLQGLVGVAVTGAAISFCDAMHFEAYCVDAGRRAFWHVTPSAMQASGSAWFDKNQPDVLGFAGGNSPYVKDAEGLIERWTYYPATDLPNGAVIDQLQYHQQQVGELGTQAMVKKYTYVSHATP